MTMSNNYNANIYLTTEDLNNIENRIENTTNEVREKVYNNTNSYLRNIQVGDNLGGKTLYLSFPRTSYENILDEDTSDVTFIMTDNNSRIAYRYYNTSNVKGITAFHRISSSFLGKYLYACYTTSNNPYLNIIRLKLPKNFGIVTNIDINNPFYQYVKIYDETIIPNYTKHIWVDNEVLTMQKIDNIEQGVKNIGYYYEKPDGWVQEKEWLGEGTISSITNYGVGVKTISYQDFNRWYNNLDLIDFDDLNDITLWNAINDISQVEWDSESDEEWFDNFIINVYELMTENNNISITENNNNIEVTTTERI